MWAWCHRSAIASTQETGRRVISQGLLEQTIEPLSQNKQIKKCEGPGVAEEVAPV